MVAHEPAATGQDPRGGMQRHQRTCSFLSFEMFQEYERQRLQLPLAFDLHSIVIRHSGSPCSDLDVQVTSASQVEVEDHVQASSRRRPLHRSTCI